jgi:oligopeptide transport system permease protein
MLYFNGISTILLSFYPHLLIFPAIIIFITVLTFNILGDALKEAMEPQLRTGEIR